MIFNYKIEQHLKCNFGGNPPKPPIMPPTAPTPTGAAQNIKNKIPTAGDFGLASTILTTPQNLMATEANQKKTLLGQ